MIDWTDLTGRLRVSAGRLSPRRSRWKRLLGELTLDPDRLPRPLQPPGGRDFIICGAPRTGTTLAAAALFQPPGIVTVNEPWDGMRLPPADLFASLRTDLAQTGRLRRGRLDVAALFDDGKVQWVRDGRVEPEVQTDPGFALGVKWPAFWRYLELLPETRFVVCLRNPVEVIASFKRKGGELIRGLDYDIAFNRKMNEDLRGATRRLVLRRALLYEYINSRMLPFLDRPNVFVLRYERWFREKETVLANLGAFLQVPVTAGSVAIHPPRGASGATSREVDLIRRHCPSAAELGYVVEDLASSDRRASR